MTLALRFIRLPACTIYEVYGYRRVNLRKESRHISVDDAIKRFYSGQPKCSPKAQREAAAASNSPPSPPSPLDKNKSSSTAGDGTPKAGSTPVGDAAARDFTKADDTSASNEATTTKAKLKLSREVVRQNVKGYMFTRFFDIVKNYDSVLEKNFPSAMKVYRVFFEGVKDFYGDMKRYLKISRIANSSPMGLRALNRRELELFMNMPRDMVKVAPALIGSSLPMVGYAIFPLVFMYPRTFLTTHFWSLQQRAEFQQLKMHERLNYNRPVFRCLQAKINSTAKREQYAELAKVLGLLGSGFHPTEDALMQVKDIFAKPPYSILSLSGKHIKLLSRMHGLPGGWFKRHRLTEHAFMMHHMDLAIGREGGVHNMHPDAIRYSCFLRGLNPTNLSNEEMIDWLRSWISISTAIQEEHISLFLHLPLFLGYNHPNNWQLRYGNSKQ